MVDWPPRANVKMVLFLCTGNYYRSRFAEELFNHEAERASLPWIAQSRGLALERGTNNVGPIAPVVLHRVSDQFVKTIRRAADHAPARDGRPAALSSASRHDRACQSASPKT
jgi:protein-tyrosine phosphatase